MTLDELSKLCDEATPGPWKDWIEYRGARRTNVIAKVDDPTYWIGSVLPENSEFIVAARKFMPLLIDVAREIEMLMTHINLETRGEHPYILYPDVVRHLLGKIAKLSEAE